MKLVNQSCDLILGNVVTGTELMKFVEQCGRNAYKSEHYIDENSYLRFFDIIESKKHYSVLEHGSVYLKIRSHLLHGEDFKGLKAISKSEYSRVRFEKSRNNKNNFTYIYTNLRVVIEKDPQLYEQILDEQLPENLEFFTPDCDDPYRRFTFRMIGDRAIMGEITRHRKESFTIESTRYVNYNRKNEVEYLDNNKYLKTKKGKFWLKVSNKVCEFIYKRMILAGESPQFARLSLNHCTKSDIIITGYREDYQHIIDLREAKDALPSIRYYATRFRNELNLVDNRPCEFVQII